MKPEKSKVVLDRFDFVPTRYREVVLTRPNNSALLTGVDKLHPML